MEQEQFECRVCLWSWLQYRPGLTEDDPELQFLIRRCGLQGRPILSDRARLVEELQMAWTRQERLSPGRLELHYAKLFLSESDHLGPSLLGRLMLELSSTAAIVQLQTKLDCVPRNGKARTLIKHYRGFFQQKREWNSMAGPIAIQEPIGGPGLNINNAFWGQQEPAPVHNNANAAGVLDQFMNNVLAPLVGLMAGAPGQAGVAGPVGVGGVAGPGAPPQGPAGEVAAPPAVIHPLPPHRQIIHSLQCRFFRGRSQTLELLREAVSQCTQGMLRMNSATISRWVAYWGFDQTEFPLSGVPISNDSLFLDAGRRGHLELIQSLPRPSIERMQELIRVSARDGQGAVMSWCLRDLNMCFQQEAAKAAIEGGQLKLTAHFLSTVRVSFEPPALSSFLTNAMRSGDLEMCRLLHSYGAIPSPHVITEIINEGYLHMLRWLIESRLRLDWNHFWLLLWKENLHREAPELLFQAISLIKVGPTLEQAQQVVKWASGYSTDPALLKALKARLVHIHPELEPLFAIWADRLAGQQSASSSVCQDDPQS